jgi:hypothetical protein
MTTKSSLKTLDEFDMKKEFDTPKNIFDKSEKLYKTWNDEILILGNIYKINNEFCVYAGDFKNKQNVPKVSCCYTIGDEMRVRHIKTDLNQELPLRQRKKRSEDDRPIDTTVKDSDNTLMILIKSAIQYKNITRGEFRKLYPNISDMNNILRCIEKGENLSWTRFTDLVERLCITYRLSIYDNDEIINVA